MNDIDKLLSERPIRPSRSLKDDFTSTIVTELKTHPKLRRRLNLLRSLKTKIGIISLGLLLVAGSAAAAVTTLNITPPAPKQTPVPNVNQTITRQLPNGEHVVGYDLHNCHFFSSPTYVDTQSSEYVYYEVHPGSTMTDAQLEASLEGVCESEVNSDNMGTIIQALQNEDVVPYDEFGTMNMLVQSITPTSITVRIDPAYNPAEIAEQDKVGLTYTRYFQGLKVYDENAPIPYSDIKAGDTVQLLMGHTPGYTYTEGIAQETTPDEDILYAIMKVPPLAADPTLFFLSVGQNLTQVKPCTTSSSGYCPVNGASGPNNN